MPDSEPPADRRGGERHLACFPASLVRPDGEQRPSIIRDLSESGALLLVRTTKIAVGDIVKLELYIADDASTFRPATGRVVRSEALVPGEVGPWLRRVAIHFDEPLTMYSGEIRSFQDRAERLGLK
jgi:hypothetical protein